MKLKYYLRGLGIGIAVTTFIMSRTVKTEELTDAQIKMRALELGMVEETVLAELPKAANEEEDKESMQQEGMAEKTEEIAAENNTESMIEYTAGEAELIEQEENQETLDENISEESVSSITEENTDVAGENPQQTAEISDTEINTETTYQEVEQNLSENIPGETVESYIIIQVEPGNGSETVSRRLYNAGLVESAVQFNRFLVDNGYDRILSVGNHEIPVGASEEDMAKILCGLQ